MKINIASVLRNDGASKAFSGNVELGTVNYMGSTLAFTGPLLVEGTVLNIGDTLEITASVTGEYETECSRCGKKVLEKLSAELFESIDSEFTDVDEECVTISGNVIDISGSIDACIFGSIPMQFLCKEDCKGLCPVCGIDLNNNECNCQFNGSSRKADNCNLHCYCISKIKQ